MFHSSVGQVQIRKLDIKDFPVQQRTVTSPSCFCMARCRFIRILWYAAFSVGLLSLLFAPKKSDFFWNHAFGMLCSAFWPVLSAAWISNAASRQEEQDKEELAPLLASTRGATASTPQHELQAKCLLKTWTLIWAAGSCEHNDHAPVHPSCYALHARPAQNFATQREP